MSKKHMKRCSTSIMRDMQIKTTLKYNLTSVRMAIIKKVYKQLMRVWSKREPSYTVGENVSWYNHHGE